MFRNEINLSKRGDFEQSNIMNLTIKKVILFAFVLTASLFSCNNTNNNTPEEVQILGAGSSFGYPIYSKMFSAYYKKTGVKTNYQSIGSGGGLRQLMNKTIDFGASDQFLNDKLLKRFDSPVVHIPTCLSAIALVYNLPEIGQLNMSPKIIAGIFLGEITQWNDPDIQSLNPNIELPAIKIIVTHRSDGSGTTSIFTDYLSVTSPKWKSKIGKGASINWPIGLGGKGNEGVSGIIKQIEGTIGYIGLTYALRTQMNIINLENKSGNFIKPTLESASLAADIHIPPDTRVSIVNSPEENAYPICSFTWILLYKEQAYKNRSKKKAKTLVNQMWWIIHDGQKYCKPIDYVPLPKKAIQTTEKIIETITYNGKPLLKN